MLAASRRRKGDLAEIISEQMGKAIPQRALVVEANPWDLTLARSVLLEAGYSTMDTAMTLRQAFELAKLHQYQIVLVNYLLPDGDGLRFMEWMDEQSEVIMIGVQVAAERNVRGATIHVAAAMGVEALAI